MPVILKNFYHIQLSEMWQRSR